MGQPDTEDHQLDWWCDGWWRDSDYLLPCPKEEVERCVEIIKPFFTSQWLHEALTADPNHRLAGQLVDGQGFRMASFIVGTGHIFESLSGSPGFSRKLSELKGPKHSSTYFEMSVASVFAAAGMTVTFPGEGREKVPDIVCTGKNGPFAVECKRLGEERWEIWESAFFQRLMFSRRIDPNEVEQIELNPRLSELRFDDEFADINEQLLAEFEREISTALEKAELGTEWTELGGLGRVRKMGKDQGENGHVSGFAVSPTAKLRRVLRNGLLECLGQLPKDMPGLAAVFSFHHPEPRLTEIAFRAVCKARPEATSDLVGLILFPGGTIFKHDGPTIFINPHSRFDANSSEPVRIIKATYKLD